MTFFQVLTQAINDLTENGFDDLKRVQMWVSRLRAAAVRSMVSEQVMQEQLAAVFRNTYARLIDRESILQLHAGISRFTLAQVKPKLHAELQRRIVASANLIKLNREQAIEATLRRFQGWATSIPVGGTNATERLVTKREIRKELGQLPFEERRVIIDQNHKFAATLNNMLALDGGAIALIWNSNFRSANYNFRPEHKERDGKIYVIRDNWAMQRGLMKLNGHQYYDEITAVGQEVFCRCHATYLYTLGALPPDMLTDKGREALADVRRKLSS